MLTTVFLSVEPESPVSFILIFFIFYPLLSFRIDPFSLAWINLTYFADLKCDLNEFLLLLPEFLCDHLM